MQCKLQGAFCSHESRVHSRRTLLVHISGFCVSSSSLNLLTNQKFPEPTPAPSERSFKHTTITMKPTVILLGLLASITTVIAASAEPIEQAMLSVHFTTAETYLTRLKSFMSCRNPVFRAERQDCKDFGRMSLTLSNERVKKLITKFRTVP